VFSLLWDDASQVRNLLQEAQMVLGWDLQKCYRESQRQRKKVIPQSQQVIQLALFVYGVGCARTLAERGSSGPRCVMGLSVGEYAALCCGGWISFQEGLRLVRARARYMEKECEAQSGTMLYVRSPDMDLSLLPLPGGVWLANHYHKSSWVFAGDTESLRTLNASLGERCFSGLHKLGSNRLRAKFLDVEGAFHSPLMGEAERQFRPWLSDAEFNDCGIPLIVNGRPLTTKCEIKTWLMRQMTSPLNRWESLLCAKSLCADGHAFDEMRGRIHEVGLPSNKGSPLA